MIKDKSHTTLLLVILLLCMVTLFGVAASPMPFWVKFLVMIIGTAIMLAEYFWQRNFTRKTLRDVDQQYNALQDKVDQMRRAEEDQPKR